MNLSLIKGTRKKVWKTPHLGGIMADLYLSTQHWVPE